MVEENPNAIIDLFNSVYPGVIMVSGGEPILWKDMPMLLEALPQHYWVILSNLSSVPTWMHHPNVKLVIAACHYKQAGLGWFIKRCRELPRVVVKILVDPRDEVEPLRVWTVLNKAKLVAHLAPVEWPRPHSPELLQRIRAGELLTSCLYNARFFSSGVEYTRMCLAGTKAMFQVGPSGTIAPCSQAGPIVESTIFEPKWDVRECDKSCYCEWHHWAGMALAEDNATWDHFVETGEWVRPTPEQLERFLGDMGWL